MIKFGSVCSGIEAASVAWEPLGWEASWFAEVDKFPSEVLQHHYPEVTNLGDMTLLPEMVLSGQVEAPDVLVGGTPCQSFSVAGMRGGLEDDRGQLTIKYVELANAIDEVRIKRGDQPSIIVWENVPGVLSDKTGAFGCFLGALAGEDEELKPSGGKWTNAGFVLGPQRAIAWRILDAQYFGVAQRRRRVFVVASAREGFCPAKVLFEWEGLRRDSPPSREARKEASRDVGESFTSTSFGGYSEGVGSLRASGGDLGGGSETIAIVGNIIGRQPHNGGNGTGFDESGVCYTLTTADRHAVAVETKTIVKNVHENQRAEVSLGDVSGTLACSGGKPGQGYPAVLVNTEVRKLTPKECERLQGFPDGFTMIPWRGKPLEDCPDGHRYKALGNSMTVNVMSWIGQRIDNQIGGEKCSESFKTIV